MAETILKNEVKIDSPLPIIPNEVAKGAELFLHPITSGITKLSSGTELVVEQGLTAEILGDLTPTKAGITFYDQSARKTGFRIYYDTNNGALIIYDVPGGGNIRIGGGTPITKFPSTVQCRSLDETSMVTGAAASNAAFTVFPDFMELSTTDAGGTQLFRFDTLITDTQTSMLIRRNSGGTYSLSRVTMGAVDSGGTGFKYLRVPN